MTLYGFYNFSNGQDLDKVYTFGLCRGDKKKQDELRSCLNKILNRQEAATPKPLNIWRHRKSTFR